MTHTDHDFPQALADFRAAVDDLLTLRIVTTIHGHVTTLPSVVDQIAEGKAQAPADDTVVDSNFESKPPIWLDQVDWEHRVTQTIRQVTGEAKAWPTPATALRWAQAATWSPSQAGDLARAATELDAIRWEGMRLLHPVLFKVAAPCPECGEATITRRGEDGPVTLGTLAVRDLWAECSACNVQWWGADIITVLAAGVNEQAEQAETLAMLAE